MGSAAGQGPAPRPDGAKQMQHSSSAGRDLLLGLVEDLRLAHHVVHVRLVLVHLLQDLRKRGIRMEQTSGICIFLGSICRGTSCRIFETPFSHRLHICYQKSRFLYAAHLPSNTLQAKDRLSSAGFHSILLLLSKENHDNSHSPYPSTDK